MAEPDFVVGQLDGEPVWENVIQDANGNTFPLSGHPVVLRRKRRSTDDGVTAVNDPVDTTADPDNGVVRWTPPQIATAGEYDCNWIIDEGTPQQVTVPANRYLWLHVQSKL
jgi:hypothetical protein